MSQRHPTPRERGAALVTYLRPELFRALCDENRLTLVSRLASAPRPLTVTEAGTCCGVHISGVSRHLATLRDAGVVKAEKQGREVRYELDCGALASTLRELADALETCRAVSCASNKEMGDECFGAQCCEPGEGQ